jgi:N-acetyl sugar amidotransferase
MKIERTDYMICGNCIMDTSDSLIVFDEKGICDHCHNFYENIKPIWQPNEVGMAKLQPLIEKIKKESTGKEYDCIIGLSGGLDSSFVAYYAKEKFGLRPLLLHVDAGWNTPVSIHNVKCIVDGLGLDLETYVVDWEEMKDLQLAFLKSQVPDADTPQDVAFFSVLYAYAAKNNIKYILTGGNFSTECVREPLEWGSYYATDVTFVKDIHKKYGSKPLKRFPLTDILKYKIYYRYIKGIKVIKPLDLMPYFKESAIKELNEKFGWQPYKHKHHESYFTRFFETYWLSQKFGCDKRRAHFSSLILTGQMTRKEALERISIPEIDAETMEHDKNFVCSKLDITREELQNIFEGENKTFRDYKNKYGIITIGTCIMQFLGLEKRKFK